MVRCTPWANSPAAMCTVVPAMAITARTKCEVAVATRTGKPSRHTIAGTWMMPPPMPRKLDRNPTNTLMTTPVGMEKPCSKVSPKRSTMRRRGGRAVEDVRCLRLGPAQHRECRASQQGHAENKVEGSARQPGGGHRADKRPRNRGQDQIDAGRHPGGGIDGAVLHVQGVVVFLSSALRFYEALGVTVGGS